MLHVDYNWDLYPDKIVLDEELNIDRLGWRGGDYFKLININGRAMLVKVDELERFIVKGAANGKWTNWYDAQPEHIKKWIDAQPVWYDSDMWRAGIVGFIIGILFGLLF